MNTYPRGSAEECGMSDLRKAAQDVVDAWKIYGTAESLRGWMDILEAALAQEPEPAQEQRHE